MKRSALILLILATAGFIFGLIQLFNLRFEAGDIYPKYSSFRADPLGCKALYESCQRLISTSRHLERWSKLGEGDGATLLYLGAEPQGLKFPKHEFQHLDTFVRGGGRLIISFVTQYKKRPPPISSPDPSENLVNAEDRWGFDVEHVKLPKTNDLYQHAIARRVDDDSPLPPMLPWHTAIYFSNLHSGWKAVYVISNDLPVLVQRDVGDGEIILCSDPYPFSNEALLADRQPALLSWLIGPAKRVIFDERHLGVREDPGLATLFRHYRLHGLVVALLFVALLFIWKSSDSLVPPIDSRRSSATVTGRGAAVGFVNLLRRNIPRSELMSTCIDQWKRSKVHHINRQRLQRVQAIIDAENQLPPKQRDPVRIYRSISETLSSRSIS
jgi:hypothetical protein